MEYGFVYIWYDRKHTRYYIGSHWGNIDDSYVCSSHWMMQAYNKRPFDFKRRILSLVYTNRGDMFEEEIFWHSMIKDCELKTRYYNIVRAKKHWSSDTKKYETISQKISKTIKQKYETDEYREKFLLGRAKVKDRKQSAAEKEKRSIAAKKSWITREISPDTSDKIRQNMQRLQMECRTGMHGKRHSEETKARMSISAKKQKGRRWYNDGNKSFIYSVKKQELVSFDEFIVSSPEFSPGRIL